MTPDMRNNAVETMNQYDTANFFQNTKCKQIKQYYFLSI